MFGFEDMLHSEFTELPFKIMFYVIIFLFGICIGSFLNVVIYRLPDPESPSILGIGQSKEDKEKASHCMTCGTKIRPIDLIPVFSWIMLRGKCHSCGSKISARYPLVESLNGFLYVLTFAVLDINVKSIITCVLMSFLICIGFIDWDTKEIYISMIAVVFFLAIPLHLLYSVEHEDVTLKSRIIGAFIISVPFFIIGEVSRPIIKKKFGEDFRAIELGDTYLMFAAGAFLGTQAVIASTFIGVIVAALGGLINKYATKESKFAFGPFLAIGIAVGSLCGNQIAQWYLSLLATEQ